MTRARPDAPRGSAPAIGIRPGALARQRPIVVLMGGPSAEHDVSIVSGSAIADALRSRGWTVRPVCIDLDARWWWLPADHRRDGRPPAAYDDPVTLGASGPLTLGSAITRLASDDAPRPVVFIALHGPFGEDGTVQACLEAAGIPYTGAGVAASAVGMDKAIFKRIARGAGLPVVDWLEVTSARWAGDRDAVLAELAAFAAQDGDERLMVKPARLGSSVGMTIAHRPDERAAAIELALRYDTLALAERYLAGARDLEVSVIGNDPAAAAAFGPGEIFPGHEFYDYVAKYGEGVSRTTIRADVAPGLRARILELARTVYRVVGIEGFARVDFLVAGDEVYVGEVNTIPGFTPISLFPTMPAEAGLDFGDVAEWIIALAIERAELAARHRLAVRDLPR